MTTKVLNVRDLKVHGRIVIPPHAVMIDRTTPYGNPFKIGAPHPYGCLHPVGPMSREHVVDHYALWLGEKVVKDPMFLEPLRGKDVVCWCWPLRCHGDVILDFLAQTAP